MDEPVRERVKAAIAARLETIPAVGAPTYLTVPALVTRSLLSIDQYPTELESGPVLGVARSSGSTFEQATMTSRRHRIVVTVWGYVKGGDVIAETLLERLWDDVARCLLADPRLGGTVMDLDMIGATETDDGALEPLGFFAQDWAAIVDEQMAA